MNAVFAKIERLGPEKTSAVTNADGTVTVTLAKEKTFGIDLQIAIPTVLGVLIVATVVFLLLKRMRSN